MNFQATINLGLENNPEADRVDFMYDLLKWIECKLKRLDRGFGGTNSDQTFSVMLYRKPGTYLNQHEDTVVIEIAGRFVGTPDKLQHAIDSLCESATIIYCQECVPYSVTSRWNFDNETSEALVYNPIFQGEKVEFNGDYFLRVSK